MFRVLPVRHQRASHLIGADVTTIDVGTVDHSRPGATGVSAVEQSRPRTREGQVQNEQKVAELNRQLTALRNRRDRPPNLRLLEEIDEQKFAAKNVELPDRIAALNLHVQGCERTRAEQGELAENAFELRLDGATLVPTIGKPFDVLAEGLLVSSSRGDRIRTCDL
jgi:hypothetical protein